MSVVPVTLFEKYFDLIKGQSFLRLGLLESHDSCSSGADAGQGVISDQLLLNKLNLVPSIIRKYGLMEFCNDFAKTQTLDVATQLSAAGVRSLDVRVCLNSDNVLWVHHTFYIYPLTDLLAIVKSFLTAHPKEMLQIKFKWTDTQSVTDLTAQIAADLTSSGVISMCVPFANRYNNISDLVVANRRLVVFVDHVGSSPPLPTWAAGYLYEYLDRYIDTNDANGKIALINTQISQLPASSGSVIQRSNLYTINYTLTPDISDYEKTVVSTCCGLKQSSTSRSVSVLDATFPDIKTAFPAAIFQKAINNVAIDYVQGTSDFAEWLLTNGNPSK